MSIPPKSLRLALSFPNCSSIFSRVIFLFPIIIIILNLICFQEAVIAQNEVRDSLVQLYESATEDSIKIKMLHKLGAYEWNRDGKKAIDYFQEIVKLTEHTIFKVDRFKALRNIGTQYHNLREHQLAINILEEALLFRKQHKLMIGSEEDLYTSIGGAYKALYNYAKAREHYEKSIKLAEKNKNENALAIILRNLADIESDLENHEKAEGYYLKSIPYFERRTSTDKDYQLALTYFRMVRLYIDIDSLEKAEVYILKGKEEGGKYKSIEKLIYFRYSKIYQKRGNLKLAMENCNKALQIGAEIGDEYFILMNKIRKSILLLELEKYEATINLVDSTLLLMKDNLDIDKEQDLLMNKFEALSKIGAYKKAIELLPKIEALRDSLNSENLKLEVKKIGSFYEIKQKESEIEKQQLIVKQEKTYSKILSLFAMILIGLIGTIFYAFRKKQQHNRMLSNANQLIKLQSNELKNANAHLKDFAQTISHDILSLIDLIISQTNRYNREDNNDTKSEIVNRIQETGKRLKQFALGLIILSKVEEEDSPMTEINLNTIIELVQENLAEQINITNALIKVSKLPIILAHQSQMIQLFQNLMQNAIKYKATDRAPMINIDFEQKETDYIFSVQDNGLGIPEKAKNQVFQTFYQLSNKKNGVGLGLSICKRIVEYYGGKIWLKSKEEGTIFYFSYPLE